MQSQANHILEQNHLHYLTYRSASIGSAKCLHSYRSKRAKKCMTGFISPPIHSLPQGRTPDREISPLLLPATFRKRPQLDLSARGCVARRGGIAQPGGDGGTATEPRGRRKSNGSFTCPGVVPGMLRRWRTSTPRLGISGSCCAPALLSPGGLLRKAFRPPSTVVSEPSELVALSLIGEA